MCHWRAEVRVVAALLLAAVATPAAAAPAVPDAVSRVTARDATPAVSSYEDFLRLLPVNSGTNRGYDESSDAEPGLLAARTAIHGAMTDILLPAGGSVEVQDFDAHGYPGRNIVGTLPGQGPGAARRYYLVAHYDSQENPGADDNASGVAGVLAAAHALAAFSFDATIVFVALDQEEERYNGWGQGSRVCAAAARAAREDIRGLVNLDMIGCDPRGGTRGFVCRPDGKRRSPAKDLADRLVAAFTAHSAVTLSTLSRVTDSDHYRFHRKKYPAVLLIEDLDEEGWPYNPYWHEASDFFLDLLGFPQRHGGRDYIELGYAAEMTKGVVGWAAGEAGLLPGDPAKR